MDTLVICIDRDNDLGEKAKVITPVVGRGANIAAAVSLATADPEDSDTNTIFGGIRILDELRSLGVDADIVSFAGDKNVGVISDLKIIEQLDEFLAVQDVKGAIFVSDGAEDESLIPIIQSRIKIDSVRRIVVMQSENLESTYYMIKNFLKDPKFLQTFFVPLGLAFIIYAILMVYNKPDLAIIGTFFVVGVYMILRAYSLNEKIVIGWADLKKLFYDRKLSFATIIAMYLLLLAGTIDGATAFWEITSGSNISYYGLILISLFIKKAILWYATAFFILILGRIFDRMKENEDYQNLIVEMLFVLSGTLLLWSASSYILSVSMPESGYVFLVDYFAYCIVISILIALGGIYFSANPEKEDESETETKKTMGSSKNSVSNKKPETLIAVTSGDEENIEKEESVIDPVKINIGSDKNEY